MSRPNPLNEDEWEGIFQEVTGNERDMLLARLKEKQPVSPVTDDPLPWMMVSELRIRALVKKTKHLGRWKALSFLLLVMNLISLGLWALVAPTLNPPLLVRLGIAAEVATELVMSEEAAHASGIPGSRTGNIHIPDDIPNPEYFGRVYPEGTSFWKTQGPHGMDYGHYAIDLACGAGCQIISPINGIVTAVYKDGYGNPTVIWENSIFKITGLHFQEIQVNIGDRVRVGDPIGLEGNQGHTICSDGGRGEGRGCGYHLHLNVYNKVLGTNVDPSQFLDRYIGGQ